MELAGTGKWGIPENRFTYNAQSEKQKDLNGGKSYFYETDFRGYDPQLGRFVQYEPLADIFSSISPYQYAFNNPVRFNDPLGLEGEDTSKKEERQEKKEERKQTREQRKACRTEKRASSGKGSGGGESNTHVEAPYEGDTFSGYVGTGGSGGGSGSGDNPIKIHGGFSVENRTTKPIRLGGVTGGIQLFNAETDEPITKQQEVQRFKPNGKKDEEYDLKPNHTFKAIIVETEKAGIKTIEWKGKIINDNTKVETDVWFYDVDGIIFQDDQIFFKPVQGRNANPEQRTNKNTMQKTLSLHNVHVQFSWWEKTAGIKYPNPVGAGAWALGYSEYAKIILTEETIAIAGKNVTGIKIRTTGIGAPGVNWGLRK